MKKVIFLTNSKYMVEIIKIANLDWDVQKAILK
jgi:hypothetical protein